MLNQTVITVGIKLPFPVSIWHYRPGRSEGRLRAARAVALPSVYRMICGMSMELLLKTIIVARGKEPKSVHHLDELAADAGVVYTPEQLDLLKILSAAIIWDGKYPVPKKEEHWGELARLEHERLFDKEPLGDSGLEILSGNAGLDWDSYSELWCTAFSVMCEVVDWLEK